MEIDKKTVDDIEESQRFNLDLGDSDEDDQGAPDQEDEDESDEEIPILESFKFRNHLYSIELSSKHFKVTDLMDMSLAYIRQFHHRTNKKGGPSFYG